MVVKRQETIYQSVSHSLKHWGSCSGESRVWEKVVCGRAVCGKVVWESRVGESFVREFRVWTERESYG